MTEAGAIDPFAQLRAEQHRRAALHTSGHAWRTAAVMTCFSAPFGLLLGVIALCCTRGLSAAIDGGREAEAETKLRRARWVVLVGAALHVITLLVSLAFMLSFVSSMPEQLEQLRRESAGLRR